MLGFDIIPAPVNTLSLLILAALAANLTPSAQAQSVSSGTAQISTAAVALPGLSTGAWPSAAASTPTAAASTPTAAGIVPRPWVLGEIKADGLKNVKMSTIRS